MPECFGEDLDFWRVARAYHVSPIEIESAWTMADVERAAMALDVFEDAEYLSAPKPPKK